MKARILIFFVFCAGLCYSEEIKEKATRRQGRVLFATTTTSTSTASTYAICWKASAAAQTAIYGCKKKKRSFPFLDNVPTSDGVTAAQLAPTKSLAEDDFSIDEVNDSQCLQFFAYWIEKNIYMNVVLKQKPNFLNCSTKL